MSSPDLLPPAETPYCELCGLPLQAHSLQGVAPTEEEYDGGDAPPSYHHARCAVLLQLEPPRFCASCGRRLKVQVSPQGWWATCSRHGLHAS
ncbi:biotin synthase auxiliary protein BsaP [Pseudarthrobacter sp. YAF2]|uniref:biotin synthase auxiliary protein BsaP n=1 Tax=Pseudarthrobacter sp. YAF2 TaxID=3233078 RepID=UPI003F99D6A1